MKLHTTVLAILAAGVLVTACAVLPTPEAAPTTTTTAAAAPAKTAAAPVMNTTNDANVNMVVNAFVVSKDAAGNETLTPVGMNTPISKGQIVEYQGLFTNHGTNRVRKMVATMDIPKGAELVGNIEPAIAQATMDGGRFVNMPIRVSVNGQAQELPLANYKGLRWTIEELGIGATAVVKYRAKIQ